MSEQNDKVLRDINLYSFDQLVEELFNRCEDCVIVTSRFEDKGDPTVWTKYSEKMMIRDCECTICAYAKKLKEQKEKAGRVERTKGR